MTPSMMALRFHGPKDIRPEPVKRPEITAGNEVKIKVGAAGICGSDLHVSQTGAYITKIPVVMGHEFAGVVKEVGPDVTKVTPGDHVTGDSRVFCGKCPACLRGEGNLCNEIGFVGEVKDGAFAEELVLPETALVKISPEIPFHLAALAEPLAVALHAVSRAGESQTAKTLVLGAGPVGALIQLVLKIRGTETVDIYDRSEYRRKAVSKRFPSSAADLGRTYDLVFETTGSAAVVEQVVPKVLAKKGRMVMVGLFGGPVPFDCTKLVESEWTVTGCAAFSTELAQAAAFLEEHWTQFEHVVSHCMALSQGRAAFDILLGREKKAMKIVFEP